jgi:hypothetical protein
VARSRRQPGSTQAKARTAARTSAPEPRPVNSGARPAPTSTAESSWPYPGHSPVLTEGAEAEQAAVAPDRVHGELGGARSRRWSRGGVRRVGAPAGDRRGIVLRDGADAGESRLRFAQPPFE